MGNRINKTLGTIYGKISRILKYFAYFFKHRKSQDLRIKKKHANYEVYTYFIQSYLFKKCTFIT